MIGDPPGPISPISTVSTVSTVGSVGGSGTDQSSGSAGADASSGNVSAGIPPDVAVPELQQRPERQQPAPPAPRTPPLTGDVELDAAMAELARAQSQSFTERIDSGERVHRLLQGRLGDLGRA